MSTRKARRYAQRYCSKAQRRGDWGPWEERGPLTDLGAPHQLRYFTRTVCNNVYAVMIARHRTAWGVVEQAQIARHDRVAKLPWTDLQRIKDDLFGPGRTAVEVFPPRSELVDQANAYHPWVLPLGFQLPFRLLPCSSETVINEALEVVHETRHPPSKAPSGVDWTIGQERGAPFDA